jgi:hypothetical protein
MMDLLSQRLIQVLESKLKSLDEANRHDMDYRTARFGFAKSLVVHEMMESFLLVTAARNLKFPLYFEKLDPIAVLLNHWLRDQMIRKGDDLEVSGLISGLISDLPQFEVLIQGWFDSGYFSVPELSLRIPESLMGAFRTILCLHLSMLEQPAVSAYLEAVRTLPREDLKRLIRRDPNPEDIVLAADSDELTSETVFFGFLFMASTMAKLNSAIPQKQTSEEEADAAILMEYVRNAIDWRLNFKTPESFSRFEEVKRAITKAASSELPYRAAKLFEEELELILDDAFHLVPA